MGRAVPKMVAPAGPPERASPPRATLRPTGGGSPPPPPPSKLTPPSPSAPPPGAPQLPRQDQQIRGENFQHFTSMGGRHQPNVPPFPPHVPPLLGWACARARWTSSGVTPGHPRRSACKREGGHVGGIYGVHLTPHPPPTATFSPWRGNGWCARGWRSRLLFKPRRGSGRDHPSGVLGDPKK